MSLGRGGRRLGLVSGVGLRRPTRVSRVMSRSAGGSMTGQSGGVRGPASRPTSLRRRRLGAPSGGTGGRSTTRGCTGQRRRGPMCRTSPAWSWLVCSTRTSTPQVSGIVSQPFLLSAVVDGQRRRHVPDYLLVSDDDRSLSTSSPRPGWAIPRWRPRWLGRSVSSSRAVGDSRCPDEPAEQRASNIRFLAGYRRDWLLPPGLLDELRAADLNGLTLADAVTARSGWEAPLVRAALFHLLWRGVYQVELDALLTPQHVIGALS